MRSAGVSIILIALTALWLYNTGRLDAVLGVIKDPSYKPARTGVGAGGTSAGSINTDPLGINGILNGIFGATGTPPINGSGDGNIVDDLFSIFNPFQW